MESLTSHTSRARFPVGGGTREGRAVVALDSVLVAIYPGGRDRYITQRRDGQDGSPAKQDRVVQQIKATQKFKIVKKIIKVAPSTDLPGKPRGVGRSWVLF